MNKRADGITLLPAGGRRYGRRTVLVGLGTGLLTAATGIGQASAAPGSTAAPWFLDRAGWGADESLRFDPAGVEIWPAEFFGVQTITVHHTGTVNDDPDPAARVRAIYRNQAVVEGFGDIGYHFLIDERGRVYEGRRSGTGIPGFDRAGQMVNAGHVAGFNAGNVGIALLGTLTDRTATRAARVSLTVLLAAIVRWHRLDPLGTVDYVNPINGATATVATIPGHRDWAPTECPGGPMYADLPAVRREVARLTRRAQRQPAGPSWLTAALAGRSTAS
jgi:hypothetical protein